MPIVQYFAPGICPPQLEETGRLYRLGLREVIELLMQRALAEKDHAVGAAGGGGVHQVLVAARDQVADGEIAAAIARRFTDARE